MSAPSANIPAASLAGPVDPELADLAPPSAARACYQQRQLLSELKPRILSLCAAVGRPTDLCPFQWAQLMAMVLDFQPDLVLELGRGCGNSTCAFTEALHHLPGGSQRRLLSLCLADTWRTSTLPKVRALMPADWFEPISALETNICAFDFDSAIGSARRVLVFWDAHGFEVAEVVLGKIMPALAAKPHVVLMHDLCDARYLPESSRLYGQNPLWTGNNWSGPQVRIGNVESTVEQAIAAIDFTSRNRVPLLSADHSLRSELTGDQKEELRQVLGELFSLNAFWFYFTLNGAEPPLTFPVLRLSPPPAAQSAVKSRGWLERTAARWKRSIDKRWRGRSAPPPGALL